MSQVTVKLTRRLLDDARALLLSQDINAHEITHNKVAQKALSLYVYGHESPKLGQEMLKQHLESVGATEQDYLRGKVKTWARQSLHMQNPEAADAVEKADNKDVLQERLQEVLTENQRKNNSVNVPDHLEREEPEEIETTDSDTNIPPWERIDLVSWDFVLGLYPARNPNPLVTWAGKDPIAKYAVRAALAQLPPPSHKGAEAKRLSKELYLRFLEWHEKYGKEEEL